MGTYRHAGDRVVGDRVPNYAGLPRDPALLLSLALLARPLALLTPDCLLAQSQVVREPGIGVGHVHGQINSVVVVGKF